MNAPDPRAAFLAKINAENQRHPLEKFAGELEARAAARLLAHEVQNASGSPVERQSTVAEVWRTAVRIAGPRATMPPQPNVETEADLFSAFIKLAAWAKSEAPNAPDGGTILPLNWNPQTKKLTDDTGRVRITYTRAAPKQFPILEALEAAEWPVNGVRVEMKLHQLDDTITALNRHRGSGIRFSRAGQVVKVALQDAAEPRPHPNASKKIAISF